MPTQVEELSPRQLEWVYQNQLAHQQHGPTSTHGDGVGDGYHKFMESASTVFRETSESQRKRKREDQQIFMTKQQGKQGKTLFPHVQRNLSWEQNFANLIAFKMTHGHCHVPRSYVERPDLASWARQQRVRKKTTGGLSSQQLHLLEEAGFCFEDRSVVSIVSLPSS